MNSTTLRLEVSGQRFYINCGPNESIDVGSDPDCKISLDAGDVLPHHCKIERTGENLFKIFTGDPRIKVEVNGLTADKMRVQSPFTLGIGSHSIQMAIVPDAEAFKLPNVIGAVVPKGFKGAPPNIRKAPKNGDS